jgi:hypothetical protein
LVGGRDKGVGKVKVFERVRAGLSNEIRRFAERFREGMRIPPAAGTGGYREEEIRPVAVSHSESKAKLAHRFAGREVAVIKDPDAGAGGRIRKEHRLEKRNEVWIRRGFGEERKNSFRNDGDHVSRDASTKKGIGRPAGRNDNMIPLGKVVDDRWMAHPRLDSSKDNGTVPGAVVRVRRKKCQKNFCRLHR